MTYILINVLFWATVFYRQYMVHNFRLWALKYDYPMYKSLPSLLSMYFDLTCWTKKGFKKKYL